MQRQYVRAVQRTRQRLTASLWWVQQFSVLQGVVAAAKTAFAMALLGVTAPTAPAVVGLVSFAVYTANDLADIEEDAINCPGRTSVVTDRPRQIAVLAACGLAAGCGLAFWAGGLGAVAVTVVPVAACLCYSVPVTPAGRRLKDVYVVNTLLVALAWALTVTALPIVVAGEPIGAVAVAVCGFFLLRSFVSVELCNVRDVAGDAAAGVDTRPVVSGIGRTRQLLVTLDLASLAVLGALVAVPHASLPALFALPIVSAALSLTWVLGRTNDIDGLCLAKDGEYLLLGLVAVLG